MTAGSPSVSAAQTGMEKLKNIDEAAYVRFASVYRQFRDIQTFRDELNKLLSDFEPGTADGASAAR